MEKIKIYTLSIVLAVTSIVYANTYCGRILDDQGNGIAYATIYPELDPVQGTASNNSGFFSFKTDLDPSSTVIISFIGYEKQSLPLVIFASKDDTATIILHEQPIALEETVVAAKTSRQKNKKKELASLLHAVYVQIEADFPDNPAAYQVVSDVKMQSDGSTWGMEQMIANVVSLPEATKDGRDSIQFQGTYCKRFFSAEKRAQADSILATDALEKMESKTKSNNRFMRRAVNAIDSGVIVHQALFALGNMRYDFSQNMNDLRHWTISNESEGETVLTHTQTVSRYLGLFKVVYQRHYIVDSHTYSVRRFSEHADIHVTIPFGIKLSEEQLSILNLVNMGENQINKFRLRHMNAMVDYNTIYQRLNNQVYTLEKNMVVNAAILGTKKVEVPIIVHATQRVTSLRTENVKPFKRSQITRRVPRQIVAIY